MGFRAIGTRKGTLSSSFQAPGRVQQYPSHLSFIISPQQTLNATVCVEFLAKVPMSRDKPNNRLGIELYSVVNDLTRGNLNNSIDDAITIVSKCHRT